MCWQSIVNEYFNGPEDARNQIEFVISTEPTDGGIYRGHRGRMEIRVDMHGVSCHGSAPERGDNAIHKMAEVIENVRDLNENPADGSTEINGLVKMLDPKFNPEHWEDARFLGRGTCTTSQIFYTSPSRCDTLFGATYMVVSPEHAMVKQWLDNGTIQNAEAVKAYQAEAARKSDFERSELNKEKTGVKLEGVMGINPVRARAWA